MTMGFAKFVSVTNGLVIKFSVYVYKEKVDSDEFATAVLTHFLATCLSYCKEDLEELLSVEMT